MPTITHRNPKKSLFVCWSACIIKSKEKITQMEEMIKKGAAFSGTTAAYSCGCSGNSLCWPFCFLAKLIALYHHAF